MKCLIKILFIVLLFTACGPMDKKFNRKEYKADLNEIKNTGVAERDILLLNYYIEKLNLDSIKVSPAATYKQLLENAKDEKMKRELDTFKKSDSVSLINAKQVQKTELLKNIINVTFISIALVKSEEGMGEFTILLNIQNNGSKDIKAFKGIIVFKDSFGEVIKKAELKYDLIIKSKESKSYYYRMKYNDKSEQDQLLSETEEEKIKFLFEPGKIIFLDGTEMNL